MKKVNNTAIEKLMEGLTELNDNLEQFNNRLSKVESIIKMRAENGVEPQPEGLEENVVEEKEELVEVSVPKYNAEELEEMKYTELKSLCKEEDLKASGKKDELVSRLLEIGETEKVPAEVVEEEEQQEIEEPELLEEEEEVLEEESETLYEKVENAVKEYSNEELADILEEIGKSPKGKRQALLAKLVLAVEEGDIELDLDEEEETEEVTESPEEVEETEVEEVEEDEEIDINDYVDTLLSDSTAKRKKSAINLFNQIVEQYNDEEITDKDIRSHLDEVYDNPKVDKGMELLSYIALSVNLVDDFGEVHDLEEPYELEGKNACCGETLKDLENGNIFCEVCGVEYEIE